MLIVFQCGTSCAQYRKMSVIRRMRRLRRKDVRAARDVFLQDVVLDRAAQFFGRDALLLAHRDVHRQQNRRRRVDRHAGADLVRAESVEQRSMSRSDEMLTPTLPTSPVGHRIVGVVADLRRQIERDR